MVTSKVSSTQWPQEKRITFLKNNLHFSENHIFYKFSNDKNHENDMPFLSK